MGTARFQKKLVNAATEILLVAPYDRYASIDRFVACLDRELSPARRVRVFRFRPILSRFAIGATRKWFGYADKFLLAPRALRRAARNSALVHFTDQSLAIYVGKLKDQPHLVNCNDLIAVRAALGEFSGIKVRPSGRILQRAILNGLKGARHCVALSNATRQDLIRLAQKPLNQVSVIPMGLHYPFQKMCGREADQITSEHVSDAPFLLNVGGNQWYKNRAGILRIYRELLRKVPSAPNLVFVGEPLSATLKTYISANHLSSKVFSIVGLSDHGLSAFYSKARALFFPSICEGFGWPIIEAQACDCPVITTDAAPMNEVAGSGAVLLPIEEASRSAAKIAEFLVEPEEITARRVSAGRANVEHYRTPGMVEAYLALYSRLSENRSRVPSVEPAFA